MTNIYESGDLPSEGDGTDSGRGSALTHGTAEHAERALGDFTTTPGILRLVPLAILIGTLSAGISLALLDMIGFFTNLFYFQRISVHLVSPYGSTLGAIAVVIPIGGGLIVGLWPGTGPSKSGVTVFPRRWSES